MIYFIYRADSFVETSSFYSHSGGIFALAGLIFSLLVYFIPSIIAIKRKHNNSVSILILNIFLGWTFLGWVLALVWSFTDNVRRHESDI
jgi:hypothetical protein